VAYYDVAMSYVAEVLQAIPPKVLTGQQSMSLHLYFFHSACIIRLFSNVLILPGNLLCDFVLSRISGDTEGIGASAKALLALEERGQWDQSRAAEVMTT
jgi:DNA repair/transcription protein MET18/MMS19